MLRYSLAAAFLVLILVQTTLSMPTPNSATIQTRVFNDCPISTLTVSNNYPGSIQITDAMDPLCIGFANLHSWSLSQDNGVSAAVFNNNTNFHFAADFRLDGPGEGEGGLRISPWYAEFSDGRCAVNVTTGEIACFGGRLPFYNFTNNHGISYTRGTSIHLEATYRAHELFSAEPATIRYRVVYSGITYDSPELSFDKGNGFEADPYGLWGILNDGRVGGYFQPSANTRASLTASWSNVTFQRLPPWLKPLPNSAAIQTRVFNDCPISTLTVSNNYPASIQITDAMDPLCIGFANLHSWSFSHDNGVSVAVFNNNSNFHFAADFKLDGPGEGDGGLRISPWFGQFVDGRCAVSATTGEIVCFGGTLPFYNFTINHGIAYTRGTTIHLEATYRARELFSSEPATIRYRVVYNGNVYDSPELSFAKGNGFEADPYGLWGMLNDSRVGGYFQPSANTGASLTANWSNVLFHNCPVHLSVTFAPKALTQQSQSNWVTVYLEPPVSYSVTDIDTGSLRLNDSVAIAPGAPITIGDSDKDGIPELAVKFDSAEVKARLSTSNAPLVTLSGLIGDDCFSGSDTVRLNLK
jgi:hypothetical protein